MNAKHTRTLRAIFSKPTSATLVFADIEALVIALGGAVREGAGSRVAFEIRGGVFTHIALTQARKQNAISLKKFAIYWNRKESRHE